MPKGYEVTAQMRRRNRMRDAGNLEHGIVRSKWGKWENPKEHVDDMGTFAHEP